MREIACTGLHGHIQQNKEYLSLHSPQSVPPACHCEKGSIFPRFVRVVAIGDQFRYARKKALLDNDHS